MSLDSAAVTTLGNDLLKKDVDAAFLLKTLSQLKTGVRPSEDLLRQTRIGVTVSKLKQHKDPEVQRQSQALVHAWRQAITPNDKKKAKVNGKTGTATNSGTATPIPPMNGSSPAPQSKEEVKVAPEKRDAQTDGVDTNKTGHDVRDSCLKLIYNGLAFMSQEEPSKVLEKALAVERAAFAFLPPSKGDPSPAYKAKIRELFQNLKNKSNPTLRIRVISGEVEPERFVRMSSEELKSPERRKEDEKIEKENMDKAMVAREEKSISTSLVCGKCHQKRVSYSQAQTRSADEPMTTFCECTNPHCGNRWKFS